MPSLYDVVIAENPELSEKPIDQVAKAAYMSEQEAFKARGVDEATFTRNFFKSEKILEPEADDLLPTRMAKSVGRGAVALGEGLVSLGKAGVEAARGDAEYDMQNVEREYAKANPGELLGPQPFSMEFATLFGNQEDLRKAYLKQYPNHTVDEDINGNLFAINEKGEKAGYLFEPGYDPVNAARFVGQTALFMFADKGVTKGLSGLQHIKRFMSTADKLGNKWVNATKMLVPRMVAQGTGQGTANIFMQTLAGREKIDWEEAMVDFIGGAGGEVLGKWIGNIEDRIQTARRLRGAGGTDSAIGFKIARKMGIEIDEEQATRVGRALMKGGKSKEQIENEVFGIRKSLGASMPSRTLDEATAQAQQLGREGAIDQTQFTRFIESQDEDIAAAAQKLSMDFGGKEMDLPQDASRRFDDAVQEWYREETDLVAKAFAKVQGMDESFYPAQNIDEIPGRVRAMLKDRFNMELDKQSLTDSVLYTGALNAMEKIDKFQGMSIIDLNEQRKVLDRIYGNAKVSGEDAKIVWAMRKVYSDAIDDAAIDAMKAGDKAAYEQGRALKKANKLYHHFAKKFKDEDFVDGIINQMVEGPNAGKWTGEEIANFLVSSDGISKPASGRIAQGLADAFGKDSEIFKSLRDLTYRKMIIGPDGAIRPTKDIILNIETALRGEGQSYAKVLFESADRRKMKLFARAIKEAKNLKSEATERGRRLLVARVSHNIVGDSWMTIASNYVTPQRTMAKQAVKEYKPPAPRGPNIAPYINPLTGGFGGNEAQQ